jgi:hypothetical protein
MQLYDCLEPLRAALCFIIWGAPILLVVSCVKPYLLPMLSVAVGDETAPDGTRTRGLYRVQSSCSFVQGSDKGKIAGVGNFPIPPMAWADNIYVVGSGMPNTRDIAVNIKCILVDRWALQLKPSSIELLAPKKEDCKHIRIIVYCPRTPDSFQFVRNCSMDFRLNTMAMQGLGYAIYVDGRPVIAFNRFIPKLRSACWRQFSNRRGVGIQHRMWTFGRAVNCPASFLNQPIRPHPEKDGVDLKWQIWHGLNQIASNSLQTI